MIAREGLAKAIAPRPAVTWWSSLMIAIGFALVILPVLTADRWIGNLVGAKVVAGQGATLTVRVPPFAGMDVPDGRIVGGGGVVIARGDIATRDDEARAAAVHDATPRGPAPYLVVFVLAAAFAGLFSYHTRRSSLGKLVRVQLVNLGLVVVLAAVVKIEMLVTPANVLAVPVAVLALVPTLVLDRIVGLATGVLAALAISLCVPFDFGIAILLLVQVTAAGLVVTERQPTERAKPLLVAGGVATALTAIAYPLLAFLTSGHSPFTELAEPMRSAWIAATAGPVIATVIALAVLPIYQLFVGEISRAKLVALGNTQTPLQKLIALKAPGTFQHSMMMASMAKIAAESVGADGELVRVGAMYHDLGKAFAPKYFIENLEPGDTSPHDNLPPEQSCDAIFAHVTNGVEEARKVGLHERIVDFMHMHHGNGVLEYFWAKCQEQGNPKGLTIDDFRYPGVVPQTRETAILAICDAVEAASRTLKKPNVEAIDALVQRIVYGKLHLGQLDASGLSMKDLRVITDTLRDTIKHANHDRIPYPWQKAEQLATSTTSPQLTEKPGTLNNELANSETAPIPLLERKSDREISRGSRDSRRELDRAAMAARYAAEPGSRDSGTETKTFAIDEGGSAARGSAAEWQRCVVDEGGSAARGSAAEWQRGVIDEDKLYSSRDGSLGPKPTDDGDLSEVRSRQQRRTNDPESRQRQSGDFVANMVLQPLGSGSPTTPSDGPSDGDANRQRTHKDASREIDQFAQEATRALQLAAPDLDVLPPSAAGAVEVPLSIPPGRKRADSAEIEVHSGARKRAATIPPTGDLLRPPPMRRAPTVPPPARRAPTVPPPELETAERPVAKTMFGGAPALRPPARELTSTSPALPRGTDLDAMRDESARARDDAATTQPSMLAVRPSQLADVGEYNRRRADASVTAPLAKQEPVGEDLDASRTNPTMPQAGSSDDTSPSIQLPLPAPALSDPAIVLEVFKEKASAPQNTWSRGLASRVDAEMDSEFGRDTPTRAPSRAELQALVDAPVDDTRQQSIEEIERLQRDPAARRSDDELQFIAPPQRRHPFPTAEISEEDIEAAIEIIPSARRTGSIPIGVAKKKSTPE